MLGLTPHPKPETLNPKPYGPKAWGDAYFIGHIRRSSNCRGSGKVPGHVYVYIYIYIERERGCIVLNLKPQALNPKLYRKDCCGVGRQAEFAGSRVVIPATTVPSQVSELI